MIWLGTAFRHCVVSLRLLRPWCSSEIPWLLRRSGSVVPGHVSLAGRGFVFRRSWLRRSRALSGRGVEALWLFLSGMLVVWSGSVSCAGLSWGCCRRTRGSAGWIRGRWSSAVWLWGSYGVGLFPEEAECSFKWSEMTKHLRRDDANPSQDLRGSQPSDIIQN